MAVYVWMGEALDCQRVVGHKVYDQLVYGYGAKEQYAWEAIV